MIVTVFPVVTDGHLEVDEADTGYRFTLEDGYLVVDTGPGFEGSIDADNFIVLKSATSNPDAILLPASSGRYGIVHEPNILGLIRI